MVWQSKHAKTQGWPLSKTLFLRNLSRSLKDIDHRVTFSKTNLFQAVGFLVDQLVRGIIGEMNIGITVGRAWKPFYLPLLQCKLNKQKSAWEGPVFNSSCLTIEQKKPTETVGYGRSFDTRILDRNRLRYFTVPSHLQTIWNWTCLLFWRSLSIDCRLEIQQIKCISKKILIWRASRIYF